MPIFDLSFIPIGSATDVKFTLADQYIRFCPLKLWLSTERPHFILTPRRIGGAMPMAARATHRRQLRRQKRDGLLRGMALNTTEEEHPVVNKHALLQVSERVSTNERR